MAQIVPGGYRSLLTRIGAPATPAALRFFNAWQRAEGGNAAYNPFNTTQPYAGASSYNSVGVRNYPTLDAGIDATYRTLVNGRYQPLVQDLRRGADALTLGRDVEASPWGTGGGVLRVLGSSPSAQPLPAPSPAPPPVRTPRATDWTTALSGTRPPRASSDWVTALSGTTTTAAPTAPKPASWVDALSGKPAAAPPASEPGPLPLAQPRTVTQPQANYPLASRGKVIGVPYKGTHTLYGNWESDNAVDVAVPTGTPVVALADGTIGPQIGPLSASGDPRLTGLRVHLVTPGNEFYYAHLSRLTVKAGQKVKAGQIIGYSGAANGVQHLHFAQRSGNPLRLVT